MTTNTEASGQVDTTAVTQGSAAPVDAGQGTASTTLLDGAATGEDGKAAEGAASADGKTPEAGDGGDGQAKDGEKPGDGKDPEAKSKEEAPAEYADFTAPDGVSMDTEVMGEFKAMAKDLNLSQEKAQQVADLGVKLVQRTQAVQAQQMQVEIAKWADSSRNDQEFGGDKLNESLAGAKSALEKFGSPELKTMLNQSGLGNHPEVIRLLHRVSKAVSEDSIVRGQAAKAPGDAAKSLYSNSQMT